MLDHSHDIMKIVLRLLVSHEIVEDRTFQLHPCYFGCKYSFDPLHHVEDVFWRHAPIFIIVAELEEHLQLLVVNYPRKQIHRQNEIKHVHLIFIDDVIFLTVAVDAKRLEPFKHGVDQAFGRWFDRKVLI